MKRFFILNVFLLISILGNSQAIYLMDSAHHYFTLSNRTLQNFENEYYTYNSLGLPTYYESSSGTTLGGLPTDNVWKNTFFYDNLNQLIKVNQEKYYNNIFSFRHERLIGYYPSGYMKFDTTYSITAGSTSKTILQALEYNYNNDGFRTLFKLTTGTGVKKYTYHRVANTNLVDSVIIDEKPQNATSFVLDEKRYYTYNNQDEITKIDYVSYDVSGQVTGERNRQNTYLNANIIQELYQNHENGNWEDDRKLHYGYDVDGKMTKKVRYNFDMNMWEMTDSFIYHYDVNDNMVLEEWFDTPVFLNAKRDYFYSLLLTNTFAVKEKQNIQITPNPYPAFAPLNITGIEKESAIQI